MEKSSNSSAGTQDSEQANKKQKMEHQSPTSVANQLMLENVDMVERNLLKEIKKWYKKKDTPLKIYFPKGTTPAQRDFIWQVFDYYCQLTRKSEFEESFVTVMTRLDNNVTAPCRDNRSAETPAHINFLKAEAISSALMVSIIYMFLIS
jgi:hypothetical protein